MRKRTSSDERQIGHIIVLLLTLELPKSLVVQMITYLQDGDSTPARWTMLF
jgi:hypothetical protein